MGGGGGERLSAKGDPKKALVLLDPDVLEWAGEGSGEGIGASDDEEDVEVRMLRWEERE